MSVLYIKDKLFVIESERQGISMLNLLIKKVKQLEISKMALKMKFSKKA